MKVRFHSIEIQEDPETKEKSILLGLHYSEENLSIAKKIWGEEVEITL